MSDRDKLLALIVCASDEDCRHLLAACEAELRLLVLERSGTVPQPEQYGSHGD